MSRCVVTRSLFEYYAPAKEQQSSPIIDCKWNPSVIEAKVLYGTDISFICSIIAAWERQHGVQCSTVEPVQCVAAASSFLSNPCFANRASISAGL